MKWLLLISLLAIPVYASELMEESVEMTSLIAQSPVITPNSSLETTSTTEATLCSCVAYVRKLSPFQPPKVEKAADIPVVSREPKIGSWALFDYKPNGHVAFVSAIRESEIEILEFNKSPCKEGKRIVPLNDPYLKGFYYN